MDPVARADVDELGMGKRPATYADLEELPPNMVGELITGELYASPRPAVPHTRAASRLGVQYVWLVDPDVHTLEVFRLVGTNYTLLATYAGEALIRAEPFDAIAFKLNTLWGK
jgi:Uma2 family endonuclease